MIPLATELLAAQRAPTATPRIEVRARHGEGGQYLPRWTKLYEGVEIDGHHDAAVTASGALIRAWVTAVDRILVERVPAAGPGSTFGQAWSQLSSADEDASCAVATSGSEVLMYSVATDGRAIREARSANDGVSYTTATRFTEASQVLHMTAVSKSDGRTALLWTVGSALRGMHRSAAGVWTGPTTWTGAAQDFTGLAVTPEDDFGVVVTGRAATSFAPRVWALRFGDGAGLGVAQWSTPVELEAAEAGLVEKFEYHAPFLLSGDRTRLSLRRHFLGNVGRNETVLTALPGATPSVVERAWREPTVIERDRSFGMALAGPGGGDSLWLLSPSRVYRAPASSPERDLSADVLSLDCDWTTRGGALELLLDNASGAYDDVDETPTAPLTVGSELDVRIGYRTAAGPLTTPTLPLFRVDRWERRFGSGRATLRIEASEASRSLDRWRAPQQFLWAAGADDLAEILTFIGGRAGYAVVNETARLADRAPDFTIKPGDTGAQAAARIIDRAPVALLERHGVLRIRPLDAVEAAAYEYRFD